MKDIKKAWRTVAQEHCNTKLLEHLQEICTGKSDGSRFLHSIILFPPSYLRLLFCRDVRRFKDRRKEFEKSSEALEGSLSRNAQAPRGKQHEVDEASNALLNARKAFRSEALDYVLEVRKDECREAHTGFTLTQTARLEQQPAAAAQWSYFCFG